MNKCILLGRLCKEPEKIETNEKILCKLVLATNANYTKDGERPVQYHNVIVWGKSAENCIKYLKKGSCIGVVGELNTRSYEKNGEKKYVTEVVASDVEFVTTPKEETSGGSKTTGKLDVAKFEPIDDNNLPF